ncbi:hypothetical protein NDU88_004160 [Pleurodeles waltl]|uniref:Secreted protein n=1 Tax=Pleurodeles waltl TaxID=8319 RepID=A0AAV7T8T4_PLEWA|nr:hypothetical protein NDU88_004160 [Pleurodeles waltl]
MCVCAAAGRVCLSLPILAAFGGLFVVYPHTAYSSTSAGMPTSADVLTSSDVPWLTLWPRGPPSSLTPASPLGLVPLPLHPVPLGSQRPRVINHGGSDRGEPTRSLLLLGSRLRLRWGQGQQPLTGAGERKKQGGHRYLSPSFGALPVLSGPLDSPQSQRCPRLSLVRCRLLSPPVHGGMDLTQPQPLGSVTSCPLVHLCVGRLLQRISSFPLSFAGFATQTRYHRSRALSLWFPFLSGRPPAAPINTIMYSERPPF